MTLIMTAVSINLFSIISKSISYNRSTMIFVPEQFVPNVLQFYYSQSLLSRNSKYEIYLIRGRTCAPRRTCFIETLIAADTLSIKILRSFEFKSYSAAQTFAASSWYSAHQADKMLAWLFILAKKILLYSITRREFSRSSIIARNAAFVRIVLFIILCRTENRRNGLSYGLSQSYLSL